MLKIDELFLSFVGRFVNFWEVLLTLTENFLLYFAYFDAFKEMNKDFEMPSSNLYEFLSN